MTQHEGVDFFDRARLVAVVVLLLAGVLCVVGGALDWATQDRCPQIIEGSTFDEGELEEPPPCPVRGIDTTEGKIAVGAGFLILIAAILLLVRGRSSFAWLALLGGILAGSVAISTYRGIGDADSAISRRLGLIDTYRPALGLTLVAAASIVAVIAASGGIAATPRKD